MTWLATTWLPRSLAGRLRLAAAATIVVALLLAGIAIALILQRFVIGQIDQRLDMQVFALAEAVTIDEQGRPVLGAALSGPPFDRPRSGWYWQVESDSGAVVSGSLDDGVALPLPKHAGGWREQLSGRPVSADQRPQRGPALHWRILRTQKDGVPITVAATAPYNAIYAPLRDALLALVSALVVLGVLLFLATLAQVRLGLKPLVSLRAAIADIRNGKSASVPTDQPAEILPLVEEVNSLLHDNREGLLRARRHVANLAHGLKTPLAALGLAMGKDRSKRPGAQAHIDLMERLIRHHLARARAAAIAGTARSSTDAGARLGDLRDMMNTVHGGRGLAIDLAVGPDLTVAAETQDFDEIFGNLIDNACKWGRSRVSINAAALDKNVVFSIEDDGPGIEADAMPDVMRPGRRIDEAMPGYGFGLPIALELAELYDGSIDLSRSPMGGLMARVSLPVAV